jgi:hypothetical protein
MNAFLDRVAAQLDSAARREFGPIERACLQVSMERVHWSDYPEVSGDPNGERSSGDCVCTCGLPYYAHPLDWRVIGYGDVPFLNVLCDGRRVKL